MATSSPNFDSIDNGGNRLTGVSEVSHIMITRRKLKCAKQDLEKSKGRSKCKSERKDLELNNARVLIKDEKLDNSTENSVSAVLKINMHNTRHKGVDSREGSGQGLLKCETLSNNSEEQSDETLKKSVDSGTGKSPKEKKYQCSICDRLFGYFGMFQKHMKTHSDATDYSCCTCSEDFIELQDFLAHFSDVHPEFEKSYCKRKQFPCSQCEKSFKSACHLTNHMRTHTGEKPFECNVCEATFVEQSGLNRHKRNSHVGMTREDYKQKFSFTCDQCPKRFDTEQRLILHRENHYKTYKCEKCDQGFLTEKALQTHDKRMHYVVKDQTNAWGDGKSKYTCSWCSRRFKCLTHLENHERIHSGVRPFACDICDRTFLEVGGLRRHSRLMHVKKSSISSRSDKPFKCEDCGKCFKDLSHLQSHSSLHVIDKPYHCDVCGIRFAKPEEVVKHKNIQHSDDKDISKTQLNNSSCSLDTQGMDLEAVRPSKTVKVETDEQLVSLANNDLSSSNDLDQTSSVFTGHRTILKTEKPYLCGLCGESFCDIHGRYLHMRTHQIMDTNHDISMQLHGEVLNKKQKTGQDFGMKENDSECQHLVNSDVNGLYDIAGIVQPTKERPFQCDHCQKTFIRAIHLHNHIMTHTGERPYTCDYCGKGFIESSKLTRHLRTHEKNDDGTTSLENVSGDIDTNTDDYDKELQSQNDNQIERPITRNDLNNTTATTLQKWTKFHFCHGCKQTYTHSENLKLHIKFNSEGGPFQCKQCLAKYNLQCELNKHLRKHMMTKVLKNQKPRKEKHFPCELCVNKKIFTSRANLKAHMRVHTGERPYVCDVPECRMAFKQQCQKTRHMRTHSGERPFVCEFCGKDYSDPATLKGHIRTHTGDKRYKCEVCGKAFTESCKLTRHRRVHTGEKPYKCSMCGNLFTSSGNLRDHERIHTGKMPYHCDICKRGFAHPSKLLYHRRTHLPDFN